MINPAETLKQRFLTVPALPYMNEFVSIDHSVSACKIFSDLILPMVSCYSHIYLENYENSHPHIPSHPHTQTHTHTHTHTHTLCNV
jgi:hypothetical protein